MISLDFSGIQLRLKQEAEKPFVFDQVRKKWVVLTPEEHVRQYFLQYLLGGMEYPASLIAIEKKIRVGAMYKRFDMIVYNREHRPWMLVECKEPEVIISEATLFQLLNYQRSMQCRYWVMTNGHQTFCADAGDLQQIKWMEELPAYDL